MIDASFEMFYPEDMSANDVVKVTKTLLTLGVPADVMGYSYLRQAILIVMKDRSAIKRVTKDIYPLIASLNRTTASRVERSIRHAVTSAWDRGDPDILYGYFGNTVSSLKGKPTNSEFIATVADRLILENMGAKFG